VPPFAPHYYPGMLPPPGYPPHYPPYMHPGMMPPGDSDRASSSRSRSRSRSRSFSQSGSGDQRRRKRGGRRNRNRKDKPKRKAGGRPGPDQKPEKLAGDAWEEHREQTGLQLLGDLDTPPGARWVYLLKDESRRSFVGYLRCPLARNQVWSYFETIRDGVDWKEPFNQQGEKIPRKTGWMVSEGCECPYRYGGIEVEPEEFPPWMVELMSVLMPYCGLQQQADWPNSCNLNLYEDGGMSVGWHSDDERLFQGRFQDIRIISFSLGARRQFQLRMNFPEEGENASTKLNLGDGDLLTMEGMVQKHFQHRVPKEDAISEPRINLTWRWVVRHVPQCPAQRKRCC